MSSTSRRCLFGGTILAAGLMAGPVAEQAEAQFILPYTLVTGGAANGTTNMQYLFAGPWAVFHGYKGAYAYSYGGPNNFYAVGWVTPGATGYAQSIIFYSYFYVGTVTSALAKWQFSGDITGAFDSAFIIFDKGGAHGGGTYFQVIPDMGDPVSGVANVSLVPGNLYSLVIFAWAGTGTGPLYSLGRLSIPSPAGAGALVALAGLVAARRRRT